MKAVVLTQHGGVENFAMQELPNPEVSENKVLVRIKACSFNPADYQIRRGGPEANMASSMVLGRDMAGVIEKVGRKVRHLKAGDEVMAYASVMGSNGTNAELISLPANIVGKKPANLSFEQAAAIPVVGLTALQTIRQCRLRRNQSIFITGGSGGVGTFFIKLAQHYGFRDIVTTAGSEASKAHLVSLGLSTRQIVDYRDPEVVQEIYERNAGKPFDTSLDFVGGAVSEVAAEVLRIGGTYADVAFLSTPKAREILFNKSVSLQNIAIYSHALTQDTRLRSLYSRRLTEISALFEQEALSPLPIQVVGGFSVQTVQRAHTMLENNASKGKLIMSI